MKVFIVVLALALSVAHGEDVLNGLKGDLQTIGGAIKQTGKDFVPYAETVGKDLIGTLKNDTLKMVGGTISDLLGQAISKLIHEGKRDTLSERDVLSGLKGDLQTIGGAIKETGKDFVPYAAGLGKDLLGTLKNDTLKMVGDTISDLLGQAISKLIHEGKRDTLTERDVLTDIKNDLQTIGGAVQQTGKDFVPYAAGVGKDLLGTLKNDTLKMVGGTISDLLGQAFANLFHGKRELSERDVLTDIKNDLQTIGGAVQQTGKDFVPYAAGVGKDLLGTLKNDTLKMVGGTISDLLGQAFANLFHGKRELSERDVLTDIKNDLQTIGGAVQQTGKDFVPFAAGIGKDLLGTFQNDTLKMVGGTITDLLGQALVNLFHGKRDSLTERDVLTGIKDDLETIGGAITQTGKDFVPYAAGVGKDLLGTLKNDTLKMVGGTISDLLGQAFANLFHGKRELSERDVLTDIKNDLQTIGGAVQQTGKDFVPFAAGIGKDLLGTFQNDTLKMVGGTITDLLGQALVNLFHGKRDLSERNILTDIKNDLETIGGAFKQTGKDFVPFAAGVGKDLLGTLMNDSAKMVGGTVSDLLGQALSKLFHGKRDLSERNILTDIKNDLETIGGAFKQTGKDFVPFAAGVGKDLLGTLMNDSAKMVGGTVSDLLGQALSKLFHGKRDLSQRDVLTGLKDDIDTIGGAIKQTGKDFVPYAANLGKGLLETVKNDTLKMVGGTITDLLGKAISNLFHFKRDTPNLVQQSQAFMSELKNLLDLGTSQFSDVIDEVFSEIQTVYTKVKSLEMHPEDAEKKIDAVAAKYSSLVSEFLQALERDVTKVATTTFGHNKRDVVGGLGSSLSEVFKPNLEAIGKMVFQPTLHPPMHVPF